MKRLLLPLLFFATFLMCGQTGNVYHEVFSKKDGLAIDLPSTMAFDDDGFLWIGGASLYSRAIVHGSEPLVIQRFNGNNFHNIPLPKEKTPVTRVEQLYKRADGQFYVICYALNYTVKVYLFNPKSTKFVEVPIDWDGVTDKSVSKIFLFKGEEYLLIQRDSEISLNKLRPDLTIDAIFSFTNNENKFSIDNGTTFLPFDDMVLIGDNSFPIIFLDWEGNMLHRYASDTFLRSRDVSAKKFWINGSFSVEDRQYTFISKNPQLHEVDTENLRVIPSRIPNTILDNPSVQVVNDTHGNHKLVQTKDGMIQFYDLGVNGFEKTLEVSVFNGTPAVKLLSENLTKDLWLITNRKELHYFKFPSDKVDHYLNDFGMRSIVDWDEDHFVAATDEQGWYTINKHTKEIRALLLKEHTVEYLPKYTRNIFVEGDTVWSNSFGKILKINKKTLATEAYRHFPVASMIRPDDSTIVYGTHRYNLMSFNTQTKVHEVLLKTDTLDIDGIEITNDKRTIVCTTDKGVLAYDRLDKTHQFIGKESLEDPFLLMVTKHPNGHFLLGSRKGDIYSYTPGKVPVNEYSDEQQSGISTILFAEKWQWWIYTFNGLAVFNPEDKTTQRFSLKDGLSHNEGNRHSAFKAKDGMFFGTLRGLNYFKPSDLQPEQEEQHLELLRVRQFDTKLNAYAETLDRSAFAKAKKIILPAENRNLELDFNITNVEVTRGETYRYRLNNGEWDDLKSTPSIRFPNLESGKYDIEIQALDFSGKPLGSSLILEVIVKNFFYKTGWFYLLLSLLSICLLGWMMYQLKLRSKMQVQFAQNLIQSQEEERTRIAKELHDSVGQQLTLIKQKAQRSHHEEVADLTNKTLEEVRSISRGLYPALLKQLGLTGSIEQLLLDIDEQTDLFVSVDVEDIDNCFNEQESLNVYRFIQENVNNVMKHSQATALTVSIEKNSRDIQINIKDNGKGFDAIDKLKQNSLGLKTMQERVKMLNGIFTLDSGQKSGTLITAEIPLKR
jgi:signal transduction histidine kinase